MISGRIDGPVLADQLIDFLAGHLRKEVAEEFYEMVSNVAFQEGLIDLRARYACSQQLATYYVSSLFNNTPHQQVFRDRFYQPVANASTVTIAQWVSDFLADRMTHIGP